ncbi:DUF1835 domain-containing protein [Pandoraea sp.]|uniref:DUF1835 domain-containing protein n=1 Tax=Pandoraea sp. TaxID=1883445 RepID=UPI0012272973|nr:DUF1835 domain-containing protein [Pandoraea sp.]MBU6491575.1 DUF1835 domain-containing protein [Burkholderiales bacterium]MDE2287386.1 DUF1835 domain-containing protein [Burkholderiales bacterium]MDE2611749.1 DUF1835 domain-containing protein [Burkholderiales bacterium]TAL52700.1 MAG: DUF1835 domain-containing protein [Pandoraea sp.]TAM16297.1 MAG: DUF1835 domain-containing protein [Pandoraea sp.]
MEYIHIVNGNRAGGVMRQALEHAGRTERVVILRDDLAIGPLREIDDDPRQRAAFWQRVAPMLKRDFSLDLTRELDTLRELAGESNQVAIWHGDSAADQLMLRRVAFHLRTCPARLNEVALKAADLDAGLAADAPTALAMYPESVIAARLRLIAPISVLRIGRLALEWRALKHAETQIRRWQHNTFEGGTFADVDETLMALLPETAISTSQAIAAATQAMRGFFATDTFLLWRYRELQAAGRLALRGDPYDPSTCELTRL